MEELTCVDCNMKFEVTQGEIDFLREKFGKDFAMPRRCKSCRKAKKAQREVKK